MITADRGGIGFKAGVLERETLGNSSATFEHDAWGNLSPGSYGSTPFKWNAAAGYEHVPFTGLYCVGAREYDPRTVRWLQRDPIGQSSGDPNLYRYCGNDAVNLADPSGLADGHHVIPKEIWDKGNLPSLSAEAYDVFNKSVTGPTNPTHGNSKAYELYNARTKTMFHDWAKIKGIPLEKMTAAQAREFVDVILDSSHPEIKNLLEIVAKQKGMTLAMLKSHVRSTIDDHLKKKAAKVAAKALAAAATEKAVKKTTLAIARKVPGVGQAMFLHDWKQGGFGHACNEALWPVSLIWNRE